MPLNAYDAFLATVAARVDAIASDAPATAHDPAQSDAAQLAHLAWSRGLDYYGDWSDDVKREVIRQAPANLRLRGTRAAIEAALGAFGASVDIVEWWEESPEGAPGTAVANVAVTAELGSSAEDQATVLRVIERESRKSIHWTLILGEGGSDAIGPYAAGRVLSLYQYTGAQIGA